MIVQLMELQIWFKTTLKKNVLRIGNLLSIKKNKGWRKNFIDGILASTGDLIFTSDQDDIWREDKIEIMEKIMLEHSEINLLASNYIQMAKKK